MIGVGIVSCLLVLAGSPAAAGAKPAAAPTGATPALVAKVQKAYEKMKDLSADFTQVVTLKGAAKSQAARTGKMWIEKPGKMRWEFETPAPQTIVSDGKTMWMFDPAENQVIVNEHVAETTSMTTQNFLEGLGTLTKEFEVKSVAAPADAASKTASFLALSPKPDADIQLEEIDLGIQPSTGLADEVYLIDQLGNVTHLVFTHVKTNQGIPAKTFEFEIPKGAEVIKPAALK
jgi:outer membrane lipoprotein carrier protein